MESFASSTWFRMFILDSLMIAGLRWVLDTTRTAAEAELNDDTVLREQLLEAEMRREMGEISDEEFKATEADLLARIREIKERREGAGPLAFGAQPMEAPPGSTFQVEAEVSGDFHEPVAAPERGSADARLRRPQPRRRTARASHRPAASRSRSPQQRTPRRRTTKA